MPVRVVGAGRTAEIHVRALPGQPSVAEVCVFDPDEHRVAPTAMPSVAPAPDLDTVLGGADAVVIASPAPTYRATVPPAGVVDFRERFAGAHAAEVGAFLDFGRGRRATPYDLRDGARTQTVVAAAQPAVRAGRVVAVSVSRRVQKRPRQVWRARRCNESRRTPRAAFSR